MASAGVERTALVALCDPAKIATLQSERGANPRIRKIAYWLEVARLNGQPPQKAPRQIWVESNRPWLTCFGTSPTLISMTTSYCEGARL